MRTLNPVRLIGVATLLASAPVILAVLLAAFAYAQSTPSPQAEPSQVITSPAINSGGASPDSQRPGVTRKDKSVSDNPAGKSLVGLPVIGSDGQNVGQVTGVNAKANGEVSEIHVKVGGLLGFGGKVVAIPAGKFANSGQNIRLALTTAEVGKLPAIDENRG